MLFVDQTLDFDESAFCDMLQPLQQRFPMHVYSVIHLKDIFQYPDVELDDIVKGRSQASEGSEISHQDRLKEFLSSLPSASSRSDMIATLRGRLISSFANRHDCFGIVYGDSTTRLAERTLSETAKGRGGSLPWLTADGMSPTGIRLFYPMRDLLKKELSTYTELTEPPLSPLVKVDDPPAQGPVSSKDSTIDGLMAQYFRSVEENYPSIVANVVRTSSRLVAPSTEPTLQSCLVCGLPLNDSAREWAGFQESASATNGMKVSREANLSLCYGCIRAIG